MGNARLGGMVDILVDTATIQRDLAKLEKRPEKNFKKFSKGKCKGVHLEQNNLMQQNRLGADCSV